MSEDLKLAAELNDKLIDAQREIDRLRLSFIEEKYAFDALVKQVEELKERRNFYQDRIVKIEAERDHAANTAAFVAKTNVELQSKIDLATTALDDLCSNGHAKDCYADPKNRRSPASGTEWEHSLCDCGQTKGVEILAKIRGDSEGAE